MAASDRRGRRGLLAERRLFGRAEHAEAVPHHALLSRAHAQAVPRAHHRRAPSQPLQPPAGAPTTPLALPHAMSRPPFAAPRHPLHHPPPHPLPGAQRLEHVQPGDIGFVRAGEFCRLFCATRRAGHACHAALGVPHNFEVLAPEHAVLSIPPTQLGALAMRRGAAASPTGCVLS